MDQTWACEIETLRTYCDKVLVASDETAKAAELAFASRGPSGDILSVNGDRATIRITGTLSKQPSVLSWLFGMGGTTYPDILDAVERVKANPEVKSVALAIDSPGGKVAGVDEVWSAVRDLGNSKHVIAENHGIMASAAYWIASAASEIVAMAPTAMTGSIGVQMVVMDRSEADKKDGFREIRIVSENAPNKNIDPATDKGRAVYQDQINALERIFIARVAEGRGVSPEKVVRDYGQGRLLIAQDPDKSKTSALTSHMIDAVHGVSSGATTALIPTSSVMHKSMSADKWVPVKLKSTLAELESQVSPELRLLVARTDRLPHTVIQLAVKDWSDPVFVDAGGEGRLQSNRAQTVIGANELQALVLMAQKSELTADKFRDMLNDKRVAATRGEQKSWTATGKTKLMHFGDLLLKLGAKIVEVNVDINQ